MPITSIPMQDYQNNSPLTAEKVQQLLEEDREARRPRSCCKNVSRSVVYAIIMAGIAYSIFNINSLRKEIEKFPSSPPSNSTFPCSYPDNVPLPTLDTLKFFDSVITLEGSVYLVLKKAVIQATAQDFCQSKNLSILTIKSSQENQLVLEKILKGLKLGQFIWLGAKAQEGGKWKWFNESVEWTPNDLFNDPYVFQNWKDGEPNNYGGVQEDCVAMKVGGWWEDHPCTYKYPVICKYTF